MTFNRCYWSGSSNLTGDEIVTDFYLGEKTTVKNCYYNKDKCNSGHFTGEGLMTAEMGDKSKYVGWDFNNTWYMGEDGLPELKF